jgi:DNA-binding beta-propeller fold protein YncE
MICRYALSMATAAMLAACSGSQPPIGAPGAIGLHRTLGHSWMLREATSEPLLYVTTASGAVDVISYPHPKLVGQLTDIDAPQGVCSDASGNVFVTAFWTEDILEFAHGGTSPIAKLGDYGYYPYGCAVDPTTGNLAVANTMSMDGGGSLAIYKNAQGQPTDYPGDFYFCAYDNDGNLLVDGNGGGYELLASGSYTLQEINLDVPGYGIQWDGNYFAIVDSADKEINRVTISGSSGIVHSTVKFTGLITQLGYDFVLSGTKVVMPYSINKDDWPTKIATARYPKGGQLGRPFKVGEETFLALTLSE